MLPSDSSTAPRDALDWRPLTLGDAGALARAHAAAEAVDRTGDHLSKQDIRDILGDASMELRRDSLAAMRPNGAVVGFVWVHGQAQVRDVDLVSIEGAVVPAARRRGVGRRLLSWALTRAGELHDERHPQRPGAARVDVHENSAGKEALVRSAGYDATRADYRMTRSLQGAVPDPPPAPAGLALTRYAADLGERVRLAHGDAFAEHWGEPAPDEHEWCHSYTGMRAFRPDLSWLILDGDEVAAYVLGYCWEADVAASGVREAIVGQLGVRRAWRRRGLGALLLGACLHAARDAGFERAVLGVDSGNDTGALELYDRAGFAVTSRWTTWTKTLG